MEINVYTFLIILGSAIVTFIPRVLPLALLSRLQIPEWGIHWLKHVPVAVMSALLAQELLLSDNKFSINDNVLELLVTVPTLLIAILTRSLLGTVLVGVLSLMILRFFF